MKKIIFSFLVISGFFSVRTYAQEYGVSLGVHQTDASSTNDALSVGNVFNFRLGGIVMLPFTESFKFRSGLMFTQRHLELDMTTSKPTAKFDYIDVPALAQYQFNENFGLYGGLIVGFNVNHKLTVDNPPAGVSTSAKGVKSMLPLFQVGINGTFQDEFGLEVYYERSVGDIYQDAKDYSVYGINFIYLL
ncbi:MAG: PorT family protein [Bdellovibrionales bacterium]|nr:PorT family protein [Bdellovibrionales bacterium]